MPAVSKAQRKLFGLALAVKRGEVDASTVDQKIRDLSKKKEADLKDFAETPEETLPNKLEDSVDENAELQVGTSVEMEHTDDPNKAETIAKDHLAEDPNYYSKLYKAGLIDEPAAIQLAKSVFESVAESYLQEAIAYAEAMRYALEENNAMATPGSVNGMGSVSLPGNPGTQAEFSTQETGSGDLAASSELTDDEKENEKQAKNIYNFLKFNAFVGESVNEGKVDWDNIAKEVANKLKKGSWPWAIKNGVENITPENIKSVLINGGYTTNSGVEKNIGGVMDKILALVKESVNEGKKILKDREGNKDTGNKIIDKYLKGMRQGTIQIAWNMISVRGGVVDFTNNIDFTVAFDKFKDEYMVMGDKFKTLSVPGNDIKNDTDLHKLIAAAVNGVSFTESVNEGKKYEEVEWIGPTKTFDYFGTKMTIKKGEKGLLISHESSKQYLVEFQDMRFYAMDGHQVKKTGNSITESVMNEAKDNLYLQLHKKYADQIKGLKAKKIKKLTDLVSVQRWAMEDREDYFDLTKKEIKEISSVFNDERKLFKKYMAGDHSVLLPESVVSEGNKVDIESLSVGNTYKDSKGYPVKIVDISGRGNSWKITIEDQHGKEKTIKTSLSKGINLYEALETTDTTDTHEQLEEIKKHQQAIYDSGESGAISSWESFAKDVIGKDGMWKDAPFQAYSDAIRELKSIMTKYSIKA